MKNKLFPAIFIFSTFICLCSNLSGELKNKEIKERNLQGVKVTKVLEVKIGSGPDNVGAIMPSEANPEGPMSFAIAPDKKIYILDQLNSRIQVFMNGQRIETINIPVKSAGMVDIELLPDGKIVLLDNNLENSLFVLDKQGKIYNSIPLEGEMIETAAMVTEINVLKYEKYAGAWVNLGDRTVRLTDGEGKSIMRVSVPGTLTPDGERLMNASIIGEITAVIRISEKNKLNILKPDLTVNFDKFIIHINGPWNDNSSKFYLNAFLEDTDVNGKTTYSNVLVVFSPELKETGRIELAVQKDEYEIYHPIKISPGGFIYQMLAEGELIVIYKYELL